MQKHVVEQHLLLSVSIHIVIKRGSVIIFPLLSCDLANFENIDPDENIFNELFVGTIL